MALALLAALVGVALMVVAVRSERRARDQGIEDILGMTPLVPAEEPEQVSALTGKAIDLAGQVVDRVDGERWLPQLLERAKVPLRPGEFVIVVAGGALGIAAVVLAMTGTLLLAAATVVAVVLATARVLRRRVTKRRAAFEAQLPDALALVASSLSAGHTFLRAIQMMCEESGPPMSEEFAQVVAETRLGDPVVDALERMAKRLQISDMDMVVQAIRIQQTVGGRLADLLQTLGEFIRARDEVRREVKILTAEGRMSAYVLSGLVPGLFLMLRLLNPTYVEPLYSGAGLILLIACGVSVLVGLMVIMRMVRIEV